MNKSLKTKLAMVFLILLIPFIGLSLLAIWDVLTEDVLWRSVASVAVLGAATAIAMGVLGAVNVQKNAPKTISKEDL